MTKKKTTPNKDVMKTLRIEENLNNQIGKVSMEFDLSDSEFIRRAIQIAVSYKNDPTIKKVMSMPSTHKAGRL